MDTTTISAKSLKSACRLFLIDLQALPGEVYDRKFGPTTRTVADIVYEVNLVNDHVGMVIRGEKPFDWPEEQLIKAPDNFRTKEAVIAGFERSSEKIMATVDALSAEELELPLKTDKSETTRSERCRFMTLHLWYHGGQLNFIQTLIGDDVIHWH